MRKKYKVLVTALGGILGPSLVKALLLSETEFDIHGCDVTSECYGQAFVQEYHQVPFASDPEYIEVIANLCKTIGVDCIIPASDLEIQTLVRADNKLISIPIICQQDNTLSIASDKLATAKHLDSAIILSPWADGNDSAAVKRMLQQTGFPVIVKPRKSSGSRLVKKVEDHAALDKALETIHEPFVQAYLDDDSGEYSVGVFRCDEFEESIAFRREFHPLISGCSWFAELDQVPEVTQYAMQVARSIGALGSINVQLRFTREGPRLLEVNPRFSSLVAARAACGFMDAEWSVLNALGVNICSPKQPYKPIKFHRFLHEVVDFGDGYMGLSRWSPHLHSNVNDEQ